MKISPELLIIKNEEVLQKRILITGLDEVYIKRVTEFIVNKFKKSNYYIDT